MLHEAQGTASRHQIWGAGGSLIVAAARGRVEFLSSKSHRPGKIVVGRADGHLWEETGTALDDCVDCTGVASRYSQ